MRAKSKGKQKGKIKLSRYFQELKQGDKVAVKRDPSVASSFSRKVEGKTGEVEAKIGKCFMVKIMEMNAKKRFIIHPIHLEKIERRDKK